MQLAIPGRQSSLSDLLGNSAGAALGFVLAAGRHAWLAPPPHRAARLAAVAASVAALALVVTTLLLRPSLPRSTYYGQWTPQLGHLAWYDGRVERAQIGALDLPPWRLEISDQARQALLAGESLHIRALAGSPTAALAPIFSIADGEHREIVLIGADRGDLVLRYHTLAAALLLEQPDQRIRGALRGIRPGAPLDILVQRVGPHACITLNGHRSCPGIGPFRGWAFFAYPGSFTARMHTVAGACWLAMLVLPACYWGFWALRRFR